MILWPLATSRSMTRSTSAVSGIISKAVVVTPGMFFSTNLRPSSIDWLSAGVGGRTDIDEADLVLGDSRRGEGGSECEGG